MTLGERGETGGKNVDADVVVVGLGTAGAHVAGLLARDGLRVLGVDHRPLERAGARWVNGVPPWMLDAAGVLPSPPDEVRASAMPFVVIGPEHRGRRGRIELARAPIDQLDMRVLVARLHATARACGATLLGSAQVKQLTVAPSGRPIAAIMCRAGREPMQVHARLWIDASGLGAHVWRRIPGLAHERLPRGHVCTAAMRVHAIADPDGARRWLTEHRLDRLGHDAIVCQLGRWGGYSIGNVSVDATLREVELLSGSIADGCHANGPTIVDQLAREHAWIGAPLFGGAGAVPLCRPHDVLVAPGIARVGNAAGQMFSASGSGIGIGLVAARMLADAISAAHDPGELGTLWAYQHRFMRAWGGVLATYDRLRVAATDLGTAGVGSLVASGALSPAMIDAYLAQRLVTPPARDAALALLRSVQARAEFRALAPQLAKVPGILAAYARHPAGPDLGAFSRWRRRVAIACEGSGSERARNLTTPSL